MIRLKPTIDGQVVDAQAETAEQKKQDRKDEALFFLGWVIFMLLFAGLGVLIRPNELVIALGEGLILLLYLAAHGVIWLDSYKERNHIEKMVKNARRSERAENHSANTVGYKK